MSTQRLHLEPVYLSQTAAYLTNPTSVAKKDEMGRRSCQTYPSSSRVFFLHLLPVNQNMAQSSGCCSWLFQLVAAIPSSIIQGIKMPGLFQHLPHPKSQQQRAVNTTWCHWDKQNDTSANYPGKWWINAGSCRPQPCLCWAKDLQHVGQQQTEPSVF